MRKIHLRQKFNNPAEFKSFFNVSKSQSSRATGRTASLKKLPIRWYWNSKENGTFSYNTIIKPKHIIKLQKINVAKKKSVKQNKFIEFIFKLVKWMFGYEFKTV